jgi:hypothetical protein
VQGLLLALTDWRTERRLVIEESKKKRQGSGQEL